MPVPFPLKNFEIRLRIDNPEFPHLERGLWEVSGHEAFDGVDLPVVVGAADPQQHGVPVPKAGLEVLDAAQTLKATVDHDGEPGAQSLALLHTENTERRYCIKVQIVS